MNARFLIMAMLVSFGMHHAQAFDMPEMGKRSVLQVIAGASAFCATGCLYKAVHDGFVCTDALVAKKYEALPTIAQLRSEWIKSGFKRNPRNATADELLVIMYDTRTDLKRAIKRNVEATALKYDYAALVLASITLAATVL